MTQNSPIHPDDDGNPPLHIAARSSNVKKMIELINDGADIDAVNNEGTTALHIATANCHLEAVELLLIKNADPNLLDEEGKDALDYATSAYNFLKIQNIKIIEALIKARANVNRVPTVGMTPLMSACFAGHIQTIEFLLKNGAKINNVIPNNGRNPLIFAAENKQWLALSLLLDNGAFDDSRITLQGNVVFGKNALELVALSGSILPENQLAFKEMFGKLLDRSDKIDIKFFIDPKNNIPDYIKDIVYKKLILLGNLNFEHLNSGINSDAVNNIIGHVMFKAIKSITKAELDEIELRDPERYKKIKKSGFNTLIKLNDICARDGGNDALIKTLIKHGGDFIVFLREFEKMMVNKEMIKNLLDIKPSPPQQALANIEPSPPQQASANIEPSTPQQASLPLSFLETMTRLQLAGHLIFEKLLPSKLKKDLHKQDQVSNLIDSFLGIYYNRTSPNKIKAKPPNPIPRFPLVLPRQVRRSASPSN